MDSEDISCDSVALVKKILEEWRFSTMEERLNLVFYFRCFYDIIQKDSCLKSQLLIDAKDYLAENNQNKSISNFCQAILWDNQNLNIESPVMFIAVRGTAEDNRELSTQLRSMLTKECLKVLQQFPNYQQSAKENPVLRSLVMRQSSSFRLEGDAELHQFAAKIYEELKALDMWMNPRALYDQLRAMRTEDILLDVACNEYHVQLISPCRYTVCRIMRFFSETFPNFCSLKNVLSLQLLEDKCDKYLERILFGRNNQS